MLFSMMLIWSAQTHGAIVNGDFETNPIPGNPATSLLPSWSRANSLDGNTIPEGINPNHYNSVFSSVNSDGTPGGSISAVFATSPVGNNISIGSISQNVSTTPGKFYDISLWVANMATTGSGAGDTGARENLFSVMWNGAPVDLTHVSIVGGGVFAAPNPLNSAAAELDPAGVGILGTYVLTATGGWTCVIIPNQAASTGATTSLTISAQNNNNATAVDSVSVTETPEPSSIVLLIAGAALAGLRRRRQQRAA